MNDFTNLSVTKQGFDMQTTNKYSQIIIAIAAAIAVVIIAKAIAAQLS